ncbi:MAG: glycosyltransferase [Lachnospiraceae bacterium]|nr:glycosyltransferase [Lachnospiraceae bacterium]
MGISLGKAGGGQKDSGRPRIAVIGPVYPYKGGISHYTGLLVAALRKRFQVKTISYSMQYPKFLFHKEQRDYENDSFRVDDAKFLINTANPINILRIGGAVNRWKPDLVIIEWWHPYFAPCYRLLSMRIHAKILFICHNVFPHERFPLDRFLTRLTLKKGSFYLLHSEKEASELKTIRKSPRYWINMHPTYDMFRTLGEGDSPEPAGASEEGRSDRKLLFFGFVRPYKGLHYLLRALAILKKEAFPVKLTVAGDFGGTYPEYGREMAELGIEDLVEIHDGYTPDREVQNYFNACDAAVLPYTDATQSGIAQIAFGFRKPVIATRAGGLPEVVREGETGVLCSPSDERDLAEAIRRFYSLRGRVDFQRNIEADGDRFSWDHMADTIGEILLEAMGRRGKKS